VVDHFLRFVSPLFARGALGLFWAISRWTPVLWGVAYRFSARIGPRSAAMGGMDRLGAEALARHLDASRPDLVVHTHPTPAGALAWLRARERSRVPHGIVFTDFVAHPQWVYPGLDRYFVPTEAVRAGVVALGVPPGHVVASGLPIDRSFAGPPEREALRAALGLEPGVPAVLVTGGMRGVLGGIADVCRTLARRPGPFTAVVVCGEDRALAARLGQRYRGDARFRVLGRVEHMARVMGAVDLVVTKAGAMTCAEALALGRPLVFYRSLPGQERANEVSLAAAGAALRARSRRELARHLDVLLAEPSLRLALSAVARTIRQPEAAPRVAKEMLALLGRG